jgi:glutathione S-transferase
MTPKPTGGFDTPEFTTAKSDGSLSANMDRAPLLMVDGQPLGQSRAIEKYIASRCGLLGRNDIETAQIICVVENVKDIKEKWGKVRMTGGFAPSEEKDKAMKQWFDTELGPWLVKLEKSIPPVLPNATVSYADVAVWNLLKDTFLDNLSVVDDLCSDLSVIKKMAAKVDALPAVKKWVAERPKTMF